MKTLSELNHARSLCGTDDKGIVRYWAIDWRIWNAIADMTPSLGIRRAYQINGERSLRRSIQWKRLMNQKAKEPKPF